MCGGQRCRSLLPRDLIATRSAALHYWRTQEHQGRPSKSGPVRRTCWTSGSDTTSLNAARLVGPTLRRLPAIALIRDVEFGHQGCNRRRTHQGARSAYLDARRSRAPFLSPPPRQGWVIARPRTPNLIADGARGRRPSQGWHKCILPELSSEKTMNSFERRYVASWNANA